MLELWTNYLLKMKYFGQGNASINILTKFWMTLTTMCLILYIYPHELQGIMLGIHMQVELHGTNIIF